MSVCPQCNSDYAHEPGVPGDTSAEISSAAAVLELEAQQAAVRRVKALGPSSMTIAVLLLGALCSHGCAGCLGFALGRFTR